MRAEPTEETATLVSRNIRRVARGALSPLVEFVDGRLERLASRLERHGERLSDEHARRLDALDERVRVTGRVVDEHLLAIGRAVRSRNDASAVGSRALIATPDGKLVLVSAGSDLVAPDGFAIEALGAFSVHDGGWQAVDQTDSAPHVRLALLVRVS